MRKSLVVAGLLAMAVTPAYATTFNFMVLGVKSTNGAATSAAGVSLIPFTYDSVTNLLTPTAAINVNSSSAVTELTLSSQSGNHDGMLRLSGDGTMLTFAGYRAASGDANPILTSASVVNRVIGEYTIATGTVNTSQALSDAYNYAAITAAVTQDGNQVWTAGSLGYTSAANTTFDLSGGVRYASTSTASTTTNIGMTQTTTGALQPDSERSLLIAGGNLYVTTASQSSYKVVGADGNTYYRGAFQVGTNVPITGTTVNAYTPVMNDLESSAAKGQEILIDSKGSYVPKSDLVFADLNPAIPGYDTAYSTGGKQEYEKWSLVATGNGGFAWEQVAIFTFSGAVDINALAIDVESPSLVDIFATNDTGIYHFTDATGYQSTQNSGATLLATPGMVYNATANGYALRGIAAFSSVPEPGTLCLVGISAVALLNRRNRSRV